MSELYKLTLTEAASKLKSRDISVSELVSACLERIEATKGLNACLTVLADQALDEASRLDTAGPCKDKPLWGVPLTLKDSFCTKGIRTTAASKMLENYIPPYESTVSQRLKDAGALIIAKTNMDEFAMGCSNESSAFGPVKNPWNLNKVPGGSSGGAAASVAAYQSLGALGTDTGGSVRQPAALCGCVGLKPSFGRVSRYGLIPVSASLDQAGPLARRVADCGLILGAIAGPDSKDSLASLKPVDDYAAAQPSSFKGMKIACPKELWELELETACRGLMDKTVKELKAAGAELDFINIPSLKYSLATYHILSSAEASSSLARFDGVRFGFRLEKARNLDDLYTGSRSLALGAGVKRRIILGTYLLSAGQYEIYFKKAAKVRRLIRTEMNNVLGQYDFIFSPSSAREAWDLGSFTQDQVFAYDLDQMLLPANLAGLPALSLPVGLSSEGKMPVAAQLIGRFFAEKDLLSAGLAFEEIFPPLL